jgi:hypothetical protein
MRKPAVLTVLLGDASGHTDRTVSVVAEIKAAPKSLPVASARFFGIG